MLQNNNNNNNKRTSPPQREVLFYSQFVNVSFQISKLC